jgi:hypothetical protein
LNDPIKKWPAGIRTKRAPEESTKTGYRCAGGEGGEGLGLDVGLGVGVGVRVELGVGVEPWGGV